MAERSEAVEDQAVRDGSAAYVVEAEIATSEDVPPGYKRTEVGVIPEDWDLIRLGDLGTFSKGQGIKRDQAMSGEIPCIRYGEIYTDHNDVVRKYSSRISREVANTSKPLRYGDLLFAGSGETKEEIGKAVAFVGGAEAYAGGDIVILRPHEGVPEFLGYLLNASLITRQKASKGQGDAVVHISASALSSVALPYPTEQEQRAIATALSDADALIESLDRLIAKKRDIKQATMQQLLTGETRLPGFTGEWETKRLGEIAELHRRGVTPAAFPDTMFHHFSLPAFDETQTPTIDLGTTIGSSKFRVPEKAVLVSKLNPRIPRVWKPESIGVNAVASTEFLLFTPRDGVSRDFLYVLCCSSKFIEQMELLVTGTTGSHQRISPANALKIEVMLPPSANEQTAIATVLSDMDAEIEALERRRDKTRQIKQGMMQELLTGRTRLVEAQATEAEQ